MMKRDSDKGFWEKVLNYIVYTEEKETAYIFLKITKDIKMLNSELEPS